MTEINPEDLHVEVFRSRTDLPGLPNPSVVVTHIPTGITYTSRRTASELANKAECIEMITRQLEAREVGPHGPFAPILPVPTTETIARELADVLNRAHAAGLFVRLPEGEPHFEVTPDPNTDGVDVNWNYQDKVWVVGA